MQEVMLVIALAHSLCCTQGDWQVFKKDFDSGYQQWSKENDGADVKRYLDTKIMEMGSPKTEADVKKLIYWVSMYKEYNVEPAKWLSEKILSYKETMTVQATISLDAIVKQIHTSIELDKKAKKESKTNKKNEEKVALKD